MLYQIQRVIATGEIIDVRNVVDGVPRGPKGEPKPWGSGDVVDPFAIEDQNITEEAGEELRKASKAHAHGESLDIENDDDLINYIITKKDDSFKLKLKDKL